MMTYPMVTVEYIIIVIKTQTESLERQRKQYELFSPFFYYLKTSGSS